MNQSQQPATEIKPTDGLVMPPQPDAEVLTTENVVPVSTETALPTTEQILSSTPETPSVPETPVDQFAPEEIPTPIASPIAEIPNEPIVQVAQIPVASKPLISRDDMVAQALDADPNNPLALAAMAATMEELTSPSNEAQN